MSGPARTLLTRDLRLAWRHRSEAMTAIAVFVLITLMFPFALGPEPALLARIAPGIVWASAVLAATIALDRVFMDDWRDGSLDLLLISPAPLPLLFAAKAAAHWLSASAPLVALAPVLGAMLGMEGAALPMLVLSMAVGTPALVLIGALAAALTLGARRGGLLIVLLVLPLYVPVVIFGAGAADASALGLDPWPSLMLLGAVSLVSMVVCPLAGAAALRAAST